MRAFYLLYIEVDLFGAVIILVLIFRLNFDKRIRGQQDFRWLLIWEIILFLSEGLSRITQDYMADYTDPLVMIAKSTYFVSCVWCSSSGFMYFECCRDSAFSRRRTFRLESNVPALLYIVLMLINYRKGFLFMVDDAGIYHRGYAFSVTYVICFVYYALVTVRSFLDAFKKQNFIDRKYFIKIGLFPFVPTVGGLIQYVQPNIPILCPVLTISSILISLDIIEGLIYSDPLTGLENRRSFLRRLVLMMKNLYSNERLFFSMIDLNDFKSINDTYGHNIGDLALVIVSDAMKQCAKSHRNRMNLCRYGGDEFAVVLSTDDRMEIRRYLEDVQRQTEVLTRQREMPCTITFSAGIAEWNGEDSTDDYIANADREMYANKVKSGHGRRRDDIRGPTV